MCDDGRDTGGGGVRVFDPGPYDPCNDHHGYGIDQPNSASEPSPVVLRVYQLKSDSAFHTAEFADIFYDDRKVLGSDLLGRKEFDLKPGVQVAYNDTISHEARYIGVIAGFRDIKSATWRVIEPAPPRPRTL